MNSPRAGLRILIVVNYFAPYVSGVSEYARAVASSLAERHQVTVLTGKHLPHLPDREEIDGYVICRAKPLFFLDKGYVSVDFLQKFVALGRQSDVVNLHLPMLESGLLSLLTSRPLLVTYQCDMALVGRALSRLAVLGVRFSMLLALARAKSVVVLSRDYALTSPLAKRALDRLIEVAPPNRFETVPLQAPERLRSDRLICGFVGRFVLEKGIEKIIEAARILQQEDFEFWLAGDYKDVAGGSVFESLRRDIESLGGKVRLLGRLSDDELVEFYRTIDVLLLPSTNRFEAFGMVQLEAMTFGATVVTSDMPGVREVVRRTQIGQLCDPGSGSSLAEAIQRARLERQSLSREQVRSSVLRHFSRSRFEERYQDLLETLTT